MCDITALNEYHLYFVWVIDFNFVILQLLVESFLRFRGHCFKLCHITAVVKYYLYFMVYWFQLCDITALSEYHFYCVLVISLNCVILRFLVNIISTV